MNSVAIIFSLLIPLIGSVVILLLRKWPNLRDGSIFITSASLFAIVLQLYFSLTAGNKPELQLLEILPGLKVAFIIEPLGMVFALLASFLWIITTLYSIGYMRGHNEQNQTRFYFFFAIAIFSTIGIAFAANMLTLFIFYEVLSLSTFPLVTHSGTDEAKRAGRVYLGVLLGTSMGLQLIAIMWTWSLTGTLDFTEGGIIPSNTSTTIVFILLALYVYGIGKAAVMPMHRWLPTAMVAPTPVSALLHAVAVVKAGVFTIIKVVVYIFGLETLTTKGVNELFIYLTALTILLSSLIAMTKDNLKARLAYSTISQLSYIVLGAILASRWSIIGSGMHIVTHAFGKITLFFSAGAIMVATHKTEISQMRGLGKRMPFTMLAFLIGSLSIIGLPPTGGLWSKWFLALGTLESGQALMLGVLMFSTLLNIAYLLPIPIRAFFAQDESTTTPGIQEAPLACLIAMAVTSTGCIVLFLFPDPLYQLLQRLVL
ncbi:MAG: monovalent cation/H+ antiporter subunit D family protein [Gammaproteobacteria bacterium]